MSIPQEVLTAGWFAPVSVEPLGAGHIHDTYRATSGEGGHFVLQRLNSRVFVDPALVMHNILRVTSFISAQTPGLVPVLVPTRTGEGFHVDVGGRLWRLWEQVMGTRVVDKLADAGLAEAAGGAFGRFQSVLNNFPPPELAPVIPGFHELEVALSAFDQIAPADRSDWEVEAELIDAHRSLAEGISGTTGYIHGDCKLNNLLFDERLPEVRCVLDLDTVMLGHWAWDYGDLMRSVLAAAPLEARSAMFTAVTRGFLAASGVKATPEFLVAAPCYMTFMLGVRYLTDHLEGDRYFKVAAHGDNLQRARRQFDLLASLEAQGQVLIASLGEVEGVVN